jgi:hypothetical protein
MLDNLREQATFQDDEPLEPEPPPKPVRKRRERRGFDRATGTTAPQRFMLAVMLFIVVCLVGAVLLVLLNKVAVPF